MTIVTGLRTCIDNAPATKLLSFLFQRTPRFNATLGTTCMLHS